MWEFGQLWEYKIWSFMILYKWSKVINMSLPKPNRLAKERERKVTKVQNWLICTRNLGFVFRGYLRLQSHWIRSCSLLRPPNCHCCKNYFKDSEKIWLNSIRMSPKSLMSTLVYSLAHEQGGHPKLRIRLINWKRLHTLLSISNFSKCTLC